jgi:hypothetical protein
MTMTRREPEILVVGTSRCMPSRLIAAELQRRRADFLLLDLAEFGDVGVDVRIDVAHDDDDVQITRIHSGETISLRRVRSLYAREIDPLATAWQLDPRRAPVVLTDVAARIQKRTVIAFIRTILHLLQDRCYTLLPHAPTQIASSKLLQLALARELGMRVPETLITGDKKALRAFVNNHPRVVAKPFAPMSFALDMQEYRTWTSIVDVDDIDALHDAAEPLCLQEAILPKTDLRVGVIGRHVIAAEMSSDDDGGIVDFRATSLACLAAHEKIGARIVTLPDLVTSRVVEFTRRLGLQYAMIDLLRRDDGEIVFLEANPHGMFGELRQAGHDPVGLIADVLIDPATQALT